MGQICATGVAVLFAEALARGVAHAGRGSVKESEAKG